MNYDSQITKLTDTRQNKVGIVFLNNFHFFRKIDEQLP